LRRGIWQKAFHAVIEHPSNSRDVVGHSDRGSAFGDVSVKVAEVRGAKRGNNLPLAKYPNDPISSILIAEIRSQDHFARVDPGAAMPEKFVAQLADRDAVVLVGRCPARVEIVGDVEIFG